MAETIITIILNDNEIQIIYLFMYLFDLILHDYTQIFFYNACTYWTVKTHWTEVLKNNF